jgi:hypothetical protein
VVNYSDNFLVLSQSEGDAVSVMRTLRRILKVHPAGPLRSKMPIRRNVKDGFDFLGFHFQTKADGVQISPTTRNTKGHESTWKHGLNRIKWAKSSKSRRRYIRQLRMKVVSWTGTFKICPGIPELRKMRLAKLAELQSNTQKEFGLVR